MKIKMFLRSLGLFFIVGSCCASAPGRISYGELMEKLRRNNLRMKEVDRIEANDFVEKVLKENPQFPNNHSGLLNSHSGFMKALKRADDCLALLDSKKHKNEWDNENINESISAVKEAIGIIIDRRKAIGDIDMQDEQGRTVLINAAGAGRCWLVEVLLEKGANPNVQDNEGITALMLGYSQIFRTLIKNGANPNLATSSGKTALMMATDRDYYDLTNNPYCYERERVVALLENGANPNIVDNDGNSALMLAAEHFIRDELELLLKHGADPDLQNKKGQTVLMRLLSISGMGIGPFIRSCIEMLLQKDINLDLANAAGNTALMYSAGKHIPLADYYVCEFLQKGANPYLKNNDGLTALALAKKKSLALRKRGLLGGSRAVKDIEKKLACDLEKKSKENLVRSFYQQWQQLVDKK